jgi:zinc protease
MRRLFNGTLLLALTLLLASLAQAAAPPDILRATLQNGLEVVVIRNALAPVVTTQITYRVGSNEAPPGFPGMAHALEHMMFRGSPGLTAAQLSTIAAAMGGDFNAATQQTATQYFFTVPAEDLEIALQIEALRMRGLLVEPSAWDQERGAIEQEVAQDLSSPRYVFYARLLEAMYPGTPYAHDALGTRESFQKTTAAMLKDFHTTWYVPNNAVLIIVGNVDLAPTLELVRRHFEAIPKRPLPARPDVQLGPLAPAKIELDSDLPYGMATVALRLPGFDHPDYIAGQVLGDVLDSKLGDLYELVLGGKALFTAFEGTALPKSALGYAVAGFPHGGDGEALLAAMKQILGAYAERGVPPELVEAAKRHEVADAEFQKASVPGLAALWSQTVAVEGRTSPDEDIEAVKRVTVADVNRVAREFLHPETAITAVLTPRPSGAPVTPSAAGRQESFTPKEAKAVQVPGWARKAVALPRALGTTIDPYVTILRNGIRLVVQPEYVSRSVSVFGAVKTNPDLQAPPGKDGVDEVMAGLFGYGTTRLSRVQFQEAVDAMGANLSAGTQFSLQVLEEHFEQGMQLLAEQLLSPAFPEEAFKVVRGSVKDAAAGRLQSPTRVSRHALRQLLFPAGDPALRQSTPETVDALTLEDVRGYYRQVFRPDMTTIVIVGRIGPEQAKAVVEHYFGGWAAGGPKPQTDLPPVALNRAGARVFPDASRVQDEVTLAQSLGINRFHPDYYTLRVGNRILSGAAFAGRLFRDLREETGLVYGVESYLDVGKTRGLFAVSYACDPPNVFKGKTIVERNLHLLQTKRVSADELRRAKMVLVRQILLAEGSVDGIGGGLLQLALRDLPIDEPARAARKYLRVSAADVQRAFVKWIRPDSFAQVTLGPSPE